MLYMTLPEAHSSIFGNDFQYIETKINFKKCERLTCTQINNYCYPPHSWFHLLIELIFIQYNVCTLQWIEGGKVIKLEKPFEIK